MPACTNCSIGPVGRFCANCGQRRITDHDFTALAFFHETLTEIISLDGRLWLTLWTLVRYPGKLAREYFDGRGARYMRPLNIFLLLNLVFFLIQPHTGFLQWHLASYLRSQQVAPALVHAKRLDRGHDAELERRMRGEAPQPAQPESMEAFESEFESTIQSLKKSMLLVAIPLFALVLGATYAGQRHRLAEHLIFSTHFYAFSVFAFTVLVHSVFVVMVWLLRLSHAPARAYRVLSGEGALAFVLFALLGPYLYLAFQRMYGDARPVAAVRALGLFLVYQAIVIMFSISMFRATLLAM